MIQIITIPKYKLFAFICKQIYKSIRIDLSVLEDFYYKLWFIANNNNFQNVKRLHLFANKFK